MNINDINLVCLYDSRNELYTVYPNNMSGLVVQVKSIEDAPEELSKLFRVFLDKKVQEECYIYFDIFNDFDFDKEINEGDDEGLERLMDVRKKQTYKNDNKNDNQLKHELTKDDDGYYDLLFKFKDDEDKLYELITKNNNWLKYEGFENLFNEIIRKDGDCLVKYRNGIIRRHNEICHKDDFIYFKPL